MALVLKSLFREYQRYFHDSQDSRSRDFFLVEPPWIPFALAGGYLYFVLHLGPKLMADRKPFDLKGLILAYNFVQVIVNAVIFVLGIMMYFRIKVSLTCQPVNYSTNSEGMLELYLVYSYYLLKVSDLVDTIFFVLRKKQSHVTFLHVYHHTGILLGSYMYVRFVPGGHAVMLGVWNTLVHTIMYLYFALSVWRPEWTRGAPWKRYITVLQMVQFGYLTLHFAAPIVLGLDCGIDRFWMWLPMIQSVFMMALFGDFYRRAYGSKKLV